MEVIFEYFGLPTATYPLPVEKIARSIRGEMPIISSLGAKNTSAVTSVAHLRNNDSRYLSSANLPAPILNKLRSGKKKRFRSAAKSNARSVEPMIISR